PVPAIGQRIAVAHDAAFGFAYEHWLATWRGLGVELRPFSPLAGEGPDPNADAVFLPGGYPELHAGRIAACSAFIEGLRNAAAAGTFIYGECGGFMTLGETLIDADGVVHAMAGLLPVSTSFATPRLTLGYRQVRLAAASVLGERNAPLRGHEFHFARVERESGEKAFSECTSAAGVSLGPAGCARGNTVGSFIHLIDRV
ncbi:MAG: cobyrinate a,c-diamide synthase, partial [Gammaproteobacteria bacterium]